MNVYKQRKVSLPINCWDINLDYIKTLVSPTVITRFIVPTIGEEHEILQIPTSHFSSESRSIGCTSFTLEAESLFSL